jgi:hypothetical protein
MKIAARQVAALSRPPADSFDARAAEFLVRSYPELGLADDVRLRRFVGHGHERALQHGFTSERDIVQYLLVMMQLGPKFDEDPQYPALRPFLDPASTMQPQWRLNVLLAAAARAPAPGERHAVR